MAQSEPHYYCFPIYGLTCEEATDPNKFLFGESTLLKGKQIRSLFMPRGNEGILMALHQEQEYLVLRLFRRTDEDDAPLLHRAKQRAKEVIAGIALPLLAYSEFRMLPALSSEMYNAPATDVLYFSDTISGTHSGSSGMLPIRTSSLHYERQHLFDVLHIPPFKWLTECILKGKGKGGWTEYLRRAATVLYTSINYPASSTQFFGCYASMEVVLDLGRPPGELLDRVKVLVGASIYDEYYVERLPSGEEVKETTLTVIRNHIAHRGRDCSRNAVYACVRLAMNVLLASARWSTNFQSPEEMNRTLSYIGTQRGHSSDPFKTIQLWDEQQDGAWLWQWHAARLVWIHDLDSTAIEDDRFLLETATCLYILREWTKQAESKVFDTLSSAMYVRKMPFSPEEAWREVDARMEALLPAATEFLDDVAKTSL